jgi:hypothetical protein
MMLACGPVGAANYTLLAMAPRSAVLHDCGNSPTCTFQSNDAGWYFSSSFSWGFAPGGDPVVRNSCDYDADGGEVDTNLRLCWHTNPTPNELNTGYRCGLGDSANNLNNNAGWVRDVYTAP